MNRAAIDIGSNSILCLIAKIDSGKIQEILADETRITSLGKGLDQNKVFNNQAMEDSIQALQEYRQMCLGQGITPDKIFVTATEAARVATNAIEFFSRVKKDLGINVKIISSEQEALYSTLGVIQGKNDKDFFIIDIGGASTELIHASKGPFKIHYSHSLPMGAVRVTDWQEQNILQEKFDMIFASLDSSNFQAKTLTACAGTAVSFAMMIKKLDHFEADKIEGMSIPIDQLEKLYFDIQDLKPKEILSRYPHLGKRSENILGGLKVMLETCQRLQTQNIQISTLGLRYATIFLTP